jgi:hypothetical protein
MSLLLDLNAILIVAEDAGPDGLAAGKQIFAIIASAGLNQALDQQGAASLAQLATDINKAATDITSDGGPAKFVTFLQEVAAALNYIATNGPAGFQAFENLYAVFVTQGTDAGVNALGAGGLQGIINAINQLAAIEKAAFNPAPKKS